VKVALLIILWLVMAGDITSTGGTGYFLERLLNKPISVLFKAVVFGVPFLLQWAAIIGIPFLLWRWVRPHLPALRSLPIPKGARIALLAIFLCQVGALLFQHSRYPILHIGMFEHSPGLPDYPSKVTRYKYYLDEPTGPRVVDIRRQGHFLFSDLLPWSNEISFSACFHNRDLPQTYRFLKEELRSRGYLSPLRLGLESYDFKTHEHSFEIAPTRPLQPDAYGRVARKTIFDPLYPSR